MLFVLLVRLFQNSLKRVAYLLPLVLLRIELMMFTRHLLKFGLKVIDTSIKDEWVSITSIKEVILCLSFFVNKK